MFDEPVCALNSPCSECGGLPDRQSGNCAITHRPIAPIAISQYEEIIKTAVRFGGNEINERYEQKLD